jgi:hypothetical protein
MDPDYVLDTSAFYSIGYSAMADIAARRRLLVSPISVYEILCHIDEPARKNESVEKGFSVHRSRLAKCGLLEMLEDPFAEHAVFVGAKAAVNPTRFDDRYVLPQMFPVMNTAATLDDFYQGTVTYRDGSVAAIKGVAVRARATLDEAEADFKSRSQRLYERVLEVFGPQRSRSLSGVEFVRLAAEGVRTLSEHYEAQGVVDSALDGAVFSSIYPFGGYRLARTQEYIRRTQGKTAPVFDVNDMEDAYICLHLNLVEPRILVTGDSGTREALSHALDMLTKASVDTDTPVEVRTGVVSIPEFLTATISVPAASD